MPGAPAGRALTALAALVLGACGGGTVAESCRQPGEDYPDSPISVAEAAGRDGELVRVRGALIARDGRPSMLCEQLTSDRPPACRGRTLRIEGLRDTAGLEHGEGEGRTDWWQSAQIGGRIEGDTVRYELTCRARNVQRQLAREVGREPTFNAFSSNVDVEFLDYASHPSLVPPEIRDRYGAFFVAVAPGDGPAVDIYALGGGQPGPRGVHWVEEVGGWTALKNYRNGITVGWWTDRGRELDERWERVDRIVRGLE